MNRKKAIVILVLAALAIVFLPKEADAHHPEIIAETLCSDNGLSTVKAVAAAWETVDIEHRYNSNVQISYTAPGSSSRVIVGSDSFRLENNFSFQIVFDVPTNLNRITVRATALSNWGPQQQFVGDEEYREVTIALVRDCRDNLTSSTTTTTTKPPIVVNEIVPGANPDTPPAEAIVMRPRFTG